MTFTITRRHVLVALVVVAVGAGAFVGVRANGKTAPVVRTALPAVMQCSGKMRSKPQSFTLACANSYSTKLVNTHWTLWAPQVATATATLSISGSNCVPDCATGEIVGNSYPATVRLSSPRSTKSGLLFTRAVVTYRSSAGKRVALAEDLQTFLPPSIPTTTAPTPVGSGYLASYTNASYFIQWQTNGGAVTGTAQIDYLDGTPPNESLSSNTYSITGQINGSQISLGINGQPRQLGTISGSGFILDVPQSDGSLAPQTFHPATAAQFNQAVAALNASVTSANSAADQAQAIANAQTKAAAALAQAESTINSDGSTVAGDIAGLGSDASAVVSAVGAFTNDLSTEKADLATTAQAEQGVIVEAKQYPSGNSGQVCSDSSSVASDASSVASDASSVASDASSVEGAVTTVRFDIGGLQSDFSALQGAEAALPSYQSNAPTKAQVDNAIASGQKAVSTAVSETNVAIDQANAYQTSAYQDAGGANSAGECGSPPSAPQAQQHIS